MPSNDIKAAITIKEFHKLSDILLVPHKSAVIKSGIKVLPITFAHCDWHQIQLRTIKKKLHQGTVKQHDQLWPLEN